MLEIDGSAFSGSGMIVRHAVAYAACTATPIHVHHVRAHRPRPGLRAQHLCAVEAVRALVGGRLDGAAIGSRDFTFVPGGGVPRGGYRFEVGTAGSVTALSLAVLPVLATAAGPVHVELVGGLFQDSAPSAFHLQHVLAPLLGCMGFTVSVEVVRPGYAPRGAGVLRLTTCRDGPLHALVWERQAEVRRLWGVALASHLAARRVSARMADAAKAVLATAGYDATIEERDDESAAQPGAAFALFADLADGNRLGSDRAGAPGRPAEAVGAAAARQLLADLQTGATLDRYASDQVLVFAALAGGQTRVRPAAWTDHVRSGRWLAALNGTTSRTEDGLLIVEGTGLLG